MSQIFKSYLLVYPERVESEAMLLRDILLEAPIHRAGEENAKASIEVVKIAENNKMTAFPNENTQNQSTLGFHTVIFYNPEGSLALIVMCLQYARKHQQKHIIYMDEHEVSRELVKEKNITYILLEQLQAVGEQITKAVQDWIINETLKRLEARDEFLGTPPD